MLNEAGRISGRAQAAIRPIVLQDLNRILDLGMQDEEPLLPRIGPAPGEERTPFLGDVERERVEV